MSNHVIFELRDTQEETFIVSENRILTSIKVKLYFHNDPSGTFTISLKQGSYTLGSKNYTMAEIKTEAGLSDNQYHWAYVNFDFGKYIYLEKNISYFIELSSSGYTFSESSYIGWCRPHENDPNENTNSLGYIIAGPLKKENL